VRCFKKIEPRLFPFDLQPKPIIVSPGHLLS
jgi:hypothetical protein